MATLIRTYSVVRDINGWRVIFDDPGLPSRSDRPQHRTETDAREWAEETLALEAEGRALLEAESH